jgi:ABC-2 type transport system permease protein
METFATLVEYKLRLLLAAVADRRKEALVRNMSTAVVLAALLYSAYSFFYGFVFTYVASLQEIGFLLIDRLVSTGFLAFFVMLVISSFIAAIATMFRSEETEYLFSTPVSELTLFASRFVDTFLYSSWAILVMAVPILYAYARIRQFAVHEYLLAGIFVLVPFLVIAVSIGTILAILAMTLSKRVSLKKLIVIGALSLGALVYAFIAFSRPTELQIPFNEDFRGMNLFINNFHMNSYPFTPNFWLVQALSSLHLHKFGEFFLYSSALVTTAVFFYGLACLLGVFLFFSAWLASIEERGGSRAARGASARKAILTIDPSGNQLRALLMKDALSFVRNPSQWAQLFLILALLAVYFLNLRLVPSDIEIEKWRTIIAMMNFGFAGFVLATLAVRFIYPSISLEGNAFWVIGTSPVSLSILFREKFWSALITFFFVAEPVALLSGLFLHLSGFHLLMTIGGIFLMSVTLSCIAVGFGAAYPVFHEQDPSRIASSPGGILTVAVSLGYVAFMTALTAVPLTLYTGWLVSGGVFPTGAVVLCGSLMLLVNAGLIVFSLHFGASSFARRDF